MGEFEMTPKTILAALVLSLAPMAAYAECSYGKHAQTTSCQDGTVWDAASGACVATTG
jgi:hypothetical protein